MDFLLALHKAKFLFLTVPNARNLNTFDNNKKQIFVKIWTIFEVIQVTFRKHFECSVTENYIHLKRVFSYLYFTWIFYFYAPTSLLFRRKCKAFCYTTFIWQLLCRLWFLKQNICSIHTVLRSLIFSRQTRRWYYSLYVTLNKKANKCISESIKLFQHLQMSLLLKRSVFSVQGLPALTVHHNCLFSRKRSAHTAGSFYVLLKHRYTSCQKHIYTNAISTIVFFQCSDEHMLDRILNKNLKKLNSHSCFTVKVLRCLVGFLWMSHTDTD